MEHVSSRWTPRQAPPRRLRRRLHAALALLIMGGWLAATGDARAAVMTFDQFSNFETVPVGYQEDGLTVTAYSPGSLIARTAAQSNGGVAVTGTSNPFSFSIAAVGGLVFDFESLVVQDAGAPPSIHSVTLLGTRGNGTTVTETFTTAGTFDIQTLDPVADFTSLVSLRLSGANVRFDDLTASIHPAPPAQTASEPGSVALAGLALLVCAWTRRRQRRRGAPGPVLLAG